MDAIQGEHRLIFNREERQAFIEQAFYMNFI